jgi:hypothetical protein
MPSSESAANVAFEEMGNIADGNGLSNRAAFQCRLEPSLNENN